MLSTFEAIQPPSSPRYGPPMLRGTLWLKTSDTGKYYALSTYTEGSVTSLMVSQEPSTPPHSGSGKLVLTADNLLNYEVDLVTDGGVVYLQISQVPTSAPGFGFVLLRSNDKSKYALTLEVEDGVVYYAVSQNPIPNYETI